jgi:TPR repeat protein
MAVAALIAGMLVFKQDLKELDLLTSELKNGLARITTTVFEPTNYIAGAFAAFPAAATQEQTSDPERSTRAVEQLKRQASTQLPKEVVNSYAMVSPGKTDAQERAVDVLPRVIDQIKPSVTPPVTAAPPVPTAPPRRLDADELAALIKRAKGLIAVSDIAPARLLLERAAEAQEPSAALLLAETYEPAVGTQDIRGITPDSALARSWYEKAVRFGSTEAQQRLAKMQN